MAVGTKRSNFMRRANQMVTHFAASQGRGGGGQYRYFRPPKNVKTQVRFFEGEYQNPYEDAIDPFFTFYDHRLKRGNMFSTFPCVQRPNGPEVSCVACYLRQKGDKSIGRSEKIAFNLLWLVDFHEIEQPSKNDPSRMVKFKQPCKGRNCPECAQGLEKVFGDRRWYSVGKNHFENVIGANNIIGQACACGGEIGRSAFTCEKCSEILLDMEDTNKTDEEIEEFARKPVVCKSCQSAGIPEEALECSECQDPTRLQIFDTDVSIMTQGEGTSSTVLIPTWGKKATPIPEELKEMATPWDFEQVFRADSPEAMASRLSVSNPFAGSGAQTESTKVDYK